MSINPNHIKKTLKAVSIITEMIDTKEVIKTGRHFARHKLGLQFDRNTEEIIESIYWQFNTCKRLCRYTHIDKETRQEIRHKYYIVEKRIDELKCRRRTKHYGEDPEDFYDEFYDILNQMREMIEAKGIELR